MKKNNDSQIDKEINLEEMGRRLGLVVAKYENGREDAEAIAGISPFTLDRYLAGKTKRVDMICIAVICKAKDINLNWLLYGDDYPKYTIQRSL